MFRIYICIYNVLTFIVSILIYPFFKFHKRGSIYLKERYGCWDNSNISEKSKFFWIHGASLGEIQGLESLIKELKNKIPNIDILITSNSNTGKDKGLLLSKFSFMLPFDNYLLISRAIKFFNIKLLIISETEIWPGLLFYAYLKKIPVLYINGRISDLTFNKYKSLKFFIKPILSIPDRIFCNSQIQAERFKIISERDTGIYSIGNTKYDRVTPEISNIKELKAKYFKDDSTTIILGSIRPEEDKVCFDILKKLQDKYNFNLIVAPRHKEKFDYFKNSLQESKFDYVLRSESNENFVNKKNTLLLDTYGELDKVYSFCDLAFIGATFVNIGGHNPLEASRYGVYVIVGKYNFVIKDIVEELVSKNAASVITDKSHFESFLTGFLDNADKYLSFGKNGIDVYKNNLGATDKVIEYIQSKITE